jgi:hypothetical protein
MAALRFYLKDAAASGSNFLSLQEGGTPPADATTSTGWTVGTAANNFSSLMEAGVERAEVTFTSGFLPNGIALPSNALGDCFRSESPLLGLASAGNWSVIVPVIAVTSGGDQDLSLGTVIWKGTAADGSNAVKISGQGSVIGVNDLTTADPQTFNGTGFTINAAVFSNEYLFVQIAIGSRGGGGAADRDVFLRVGSGAYVETSEFITPPPTAIMPTYQAQQVSRRYRPVGY